MVDIDNKIAESKSDRNCSNFQNKEQKDYPLFLGIQQMNFT